MSKKQVRTALLWLAMVGVTATTGVLLCAGESGQPDATPAAQLTGLDLNRLAVDGRFDQLLASLQASPDGVDDPQVASLETEIKSFQAHRLTADRQQAAAFAKAIARMEEQAGAGEIEEALVSAVDAHDLAADPPSFLKDERTMALVKEADSQAQAAEKSGDWVQALSLYRVLDLLFEDYGTYHQRVKTTSRHVRVLRFYAPARFDQLMEDRIKQLEKWHAADVAREKAKGHLPPQTQAAAKVGDREEPKLSRRDEERWQDKLADIDMSMFRQTVNQAAHGHVSNAGYAPLLRGAIDGLLTMIDTRGLEASFPSLGDHDKLQAFRQALVATRKDLDDNTDELNVFDLSTLIKRVVAANNDTVQLPEAVLTYEMTEGALDTLDEFSAVIWPEEVAGFRRNFQGNFYGVGIQISLRDDQLLVVSPLEDTPAQRAGIRAGDIIVSVDGKDASGWSLDEAVRQITGPEGTPVTLGITRRSPRSEGKVASLTFNLKRAQIPIESIRGWQHRPEGGWDYYVDRQAKIGYIRLSQFIPQSAEDLDAAINQMEKEGGCDALILDLRFDPGGLLVAAVDVANRFIPSGVIVSTVGAGDEKGYRADPSRCHDHMPLAVLINGGSASASEILSGALQDYQRATIIGTRSFGKGSVQDVFPLDNDRDKALLKLTTQYYKLPNGRIIHRKPESRTWGIEPDVKVPMTAQQIADWIDLRQDADIIQSPADAADPGAVKVPAAQEILDKGMDPQLETAMLILKTRLVAPRIHLAQGAGAAGAVEK